MGVFSDKKEACGLVGITQHPHATALTATGLFALQHRGEEACGIAWWDEGRIHSTLASGLVQKNFSHLLGHKISPAEIQNAARLKTTHPPVIGHTRYSVTGGNELRNIQPLVVEHLKGSFALAHNGNLSNSRELKYKLEQRGAIFQTTNDSEIFVHLIAQSTASSFKDSIIDALQHIEGAYSLLILCKDQLYAIRDPHGFRPLCLGRIPITPTQQAMVVASETCALDFMNAESMGSVRPGELVTLNVNAKDGAFTREPIFSTESIRARKIQEARCIFELIYFSRPDSVVFNEPVYAFRKELGRLLAQEAPAEADIVVPIPDSGNIAALGYAEASGISLEFAITRNHYTSRSFIQPNKAVRKQMVSLKLNPIKHLIKGKRIIIIDDSIVRGTTTKAKIIQLRACGAKEIHMRVTSPPITHGCYYGIDFPDKSSLIANNKTIAEICEHLGLDSLAFIKLDTMLKATPTQKRFCTACFTGDYPTAIDIKQNKAVLSLRSH